MTSCAATPTVRLAWAPARGSRLDDVTARGGPSMVVEIRRALMAYDEGRDADAGCARGYAVAYLSCPRAQGDRRQQRFDARTRARPLP